VPKVVVFDRIYFSFFFLFIYNMKSNIKCTVRSLREAEKAIKESEKRLARINNILQKVQKLHEEITKMIEESEKNKLKVELPS
jgi:hypothetical protein